MNYILDYKGQKTILPFNVEDDCIKEAYIDVVTGDEILHVIIELEDGSITEQIHDSSDDRIRDYFDCGCQIKIDGNICYPDGFENRKRAYGYY